MKIVTAHQLSLFPWIGYFHKASLSDDYIIMDDSQFRARAFMHRSHIEVNSSPLWLTWPILRPTSTQLIKDLRFTSKENLLIWLQAKSQTISSAYKRYSFFSDLQGFLFDLMTYVDSSLDPTPLDICIWTHHIVKDKLSLNYNLILESELRCEQSNSPTMKLAQHIKKTLADVYITGENSLEYCKFNELQPECQKLYVQKFSYKKCLDYQTSSVPLSFIHQLACVGWNKLRDLMYADNINQDILRAQMMHYNYGVGASFSSDILLLLE